MLDELSNTWHLTYYTSHFYLVTSTFHITTLHICTHKYALPCNFHIPPSTLHFTYVHLTPHLSPHSSPSGSCWSRWTTSATRCEAHASWQGEEGSTTPRHPDTDTDWNIQIQRWARRHWELEDRKILKGFFGDWKGCSYNMICRCIALH